MVVMAVILMAMVVMGMRSMRVIAVIVMLDLIASGDHAATTRALMRFTQLTQHEPA